MPPVLRRREKKNEEDGVVGTEEREKRYQMGESVARERRLWVFTFRNWGKVWLVVNSLEFFGISNGISIEK